MMTSNETQIQQLNDDCNTLLSAKKIIIDYYSNYETNSNASKLDDCLSEIGNDIDNPFFLMKNNQKSSIQMLDTLYIIKKSKLLHLN